MKRLLVVLIGMGCAATSAFCQIPGKVGVYADPAGSDCNIVDEGDVVEAHMLHVMTDGAKAVQFKLDVSATGWIHLGDNWTPSMLTLGSSIEGVSIAYTECLSGSIYLGVALFLGMSVPPCTEIAIVADPTPGIIKAVTCFDELFFPTGGYAVVNADPTCRCSVPVQQTTWGGIKALYR